MANFAVLNVDNPNELLQAGTLQGRSVGADLASLEEHVTSRAAVIYKAQSTKGFLLAIKVVFAPDVQPPHNVKKEARLLAQLEHPNICALLNAYFINAHYLLVMPFYRLCLATLLDNPAFIPSHSAFELIARHLIRQMCNAVAYLESQQIAHRDIAPANWVINDSGSIALVDFGVAWTSSDPGQEGRTNLQFELGTGAYRAPELLFGARAYDPLALDRFSLGATIASFFTPIEAEAPASPASSEEFAAYRWAPPRKGIIRRKSLFEGGHSDFTLIGSIFKIMGTPTSETWPESATLPDFGKFSYRAFAPRDLSTLLPNAPSQKAVDLVASFLKYPYNERASAAVASQNPWLKREVESAESTQADVIGAFIALL